MDLLGDTQDGTYNHASLSNSPLSTQNGAEITQTVADGIFLHKTGRSMNSWNFSEGRRQ